MTKIVALSNQKGGVGKTTTAINLATAIAACNKRVLVIDFDPQGNASTGFGFSKDSSHENVYTLITGKSNIHNTIKKTNIDNVDLIPSTIDLSAAELELVGIVAREYKLVNELNKIKDNYDYIFIDCPPSLGLLTVNALTAATDILIPLQSEFFAMEGLAQLFRTIDLVKKSLNPALNIMGILLTMYDKRNKLSSAVENDVREFLGDKVFNVVIPRNVRVSEAPSHGKPALVYDINCLGSISYMKLAAEVLKK